MELTKMQQYVLDLCLQVGRAHGLAGRGRICFDDSNRADCAYRWNGVQYEYHIRFGERYLVDMFYKGHEYPSLRYLLQGRQVQNLRGAHWIALHEMAHAILSAKWESRYGRSLRAGTGMAIPWHGSEFAAQLDALVVEFPLPLEVWTQEDLSPRERDILAALEQAASDYAANERIRKDTGTRQQMLVQLGTWIAWKHKGVTYAGRVEGMTAELVTVRTPRIHWTLRWGDFEIVTRGEGERILDTLRAVSSKKLTQQANNAIFG